MSLKSMLLEAERQAAIMSMLPVCFGDTLKAHMERKRFTQESLAEAVGMDPRTIQRMISGNQASFRNVIAISLAMELSYIETEDLLKKAGLLLLQTNKEHLLFMQMLHMGGLGDLGIVNAELSELGVQRLGGGSI